MSHTKLGTKVEISKETYEWYEKKSNVEIYRERKLQQRFLYFTRTGDYYWAFYLSSKQVGHLDPFALGFLLKII